MSRTFRIGVVIAVLLAVATVLIAPTIDMPETTLREHQVTSHFSSEHAPGNLVTWCAAGASVIASHETTARLAISAHFGGRRRVPSSLVLRC